MSSSLAGRTEALTEAVMAAEGRVPEAVLAPARDVLARARERSALPAFFHFHRPLPERKKPALAGRLRWLSSVGDQSTNSTVTPALVILASSVASQLVRRMQPWLWVLPILDGSGVPWMP